MTYSASFPILLDGYLVSPKEPSTLSLSLSLEGWAPGSWSWPPPGSETLSLPDSPSKQGFSPQAVPSDCLRSLPQALQTQPIPSPNPNFAKSETRYQLSLCDSLGLWIIIFSSQSTHPPKLLPSAPMHLPSTPTRPSVAALLFALAGTHWALQVPFALPGTLLLSLFPFGDC